MFNFSTPILNLRKRLPFWCVQLSGAIRVGTSGWSYKEWVGIFYPSEDRMFSFYTKVFNTTEINSTFYSYPTAALVRGWQRSAPAGFKFTAKVPREITHKRKLEASVENRRSLEKFIELMRPLRDDGKLGPLLLQLPPSLRKSAPLLKKFFEILPSGFEYAVEFREESWLCGEVFDLLRDYGVAYVIVDEPLLPAIIEVTSDIAYIRWHGRGRHPWYNYRYKEEELQEWVPRVRDLMSRVAELYCLFNNHFYGYAALNALQLLRLLGMQNGYQAEVERRMLETMEKGVAGCREEAPVQMTVTGEVVPANLESLLSSFIDWKRLARARRISDRDINILRADRDMVKAQIRDYKIIVDVKERRIVHNCADWSRTAVERRFCKHLARLFLSLPEELALEILRKIYSERDKWSFVHEA